MSIRSPDTTPDSFEEWFERFGQPYEAAVIDNGGTPWVLDPAKRSTTARNLGLSEDADPMHLRRALWERRNTPRGTTTR